MALLTASPALGAPNGRLIPLDEISAYFNAMTTAEASFTQINDDQTISTGHLKIKRPGRMRFDYNPPEKSLVIAGGGQIAIFDGRSNAGRPEQYPLRMTPLNLILERRVDLARRNMVVDHYADDIKTTVVAQDPDRPEHGSIELIFTDAPIELRQWIVVDGSGTRTTMILNDLIEGRDIPSIAFSIQAETRKSER
jgi:outer membrane lipoprotein-sorting protein